MEYIEWEEPVPCTTATGEFRFGTQRVRISCEDAIDFQRYMLLREPSPWKLEDLEDRKLLNDFILTNFGEVTVSDSWKPSGR